MKRISVIIGIFVGIFALIGGLYSWDCTYTRAARTDQLEQRVNKRELQEDARYLRQRLWDMERNYGPAKAKRMPEYQHIQNEREEILRELR